MSIIQGTAKASGDASFFPFEISSSLRFDGGNSYLSKSFGSGGSTTTWTLSLWLKRSKLSSESYIFGTGSTSDSSNYFYLQSNGADTFVMGNYSGNVKIYGDLLLRDVSSWYHFVIVFDSTNSIFKMYINGVEPPYGTQNTTSSAQSINSNRTHYIGLREGATHYFSGYMAEINFIDGQALNPYYFGEFKHGSVWIPKQFDGTASDTTYNVSGASNAYGTNGFRLTFENGIETIGGVANQIRDESSNSNHWTKN